MRASYTGSTPKRMVSRQTIPHELLRACVAQGGAIYMNAGTLELQNSQLAHNKAVVHIIRARTRMRGVHGRLRVHTVRAV